MKCVHNARHLTEAHLIRDLLESHGIEAMIRGEFLTGGWGELPVDACAVWVTDETRFREADDLLRDFLRGLPDSSAKSGHWSCPQCSEPLEPQFTACWKCGAPRPATT